MELKIAKADHLQRIMELINDAKAYLKSCGVDQWQNGYPDQHSIENDIRKGTGYLCIADEKIVGYVCIDFEGEPAYETLCGKWLAHSPMLLSTVWHWIGTAEGRAWLPRFSLSPRSLHKKGISTVLKWTQTTIMKS